MIVRKWIVLLLFLALGSGAVGSELPGAIWWASEGGGMRGGRGGGMRGGRGGGMRGNRAGEMHGGGSSGHGAADGSGAETDPNPKKGESDLSGENEQSENKNASGEPRHGRSPEARQRMKRHSREGGGGPPPEVMERMMKRMQEGEGGPPHGMPPGMMSKMGGEGGGPPHGTPPGGQGGKHPGGMPDTGSARSGSGDSGDKMPSRAEMMAAMRKPKPMLLRWGEFPATQGKDSELGSLVRVENVEAWVRTPDGAIVEAVVGEENGAVSTKCPPESLGEDDSPNGVYVVGMHLDAGVMDLDSDGKMERVHFYSNGFSSRFSRDGASGKQPDVFFKAPDKVALEIGPVDTATGRGGFMATSQTGMEENKLQVLFRGEPLANAEVSVLSSSGWKNRLTTDEDGILTVVPVGKKSDGRMRMRSSNQCLYVVLHKEESPGELEGAAYETEYHCASLLLGVRMPGPEWKSKSEGVRLATISGLGFLVLAGTFGMYRRRRRAREVMIQFDQHRISRGDA